MTIFGDFTIFGNFDHSFLDFFLFDFFSTFSEFFSCRFDTSGSMIRLSVPEIEGGSPERDGGEEGLVLEYSSSWIGINAQNLKWQTSIYHRTL